MGQNGPTDVLSQRPMGARCTLRSDVNFGTGGKLDGMNGMQPYHFVHGLSWVQVVPNKRRLDFRSTMIMYTNNK